MFNKLTVALAMASAVTAHPALQSRQNPCEDAYKACVAAGTPDVACLCTLTTCLGEDSARQRDFCATATANLPKPTSTGTPSAPAPPSFTPIPGIPGGCNPAHPGSCPSYYFTYPTLTATVTPSFTSIPGIPESYPTFSTTAAPAPVPTPTAGSGSSTGYTDPKPVAGKTWTIKDLTRYCGEGNSGCDYNFKIEADGKTEACTVIRMPGKDAATESWSDQPCTFGSNFKVSWGYVTEPGPAFAILSVVEGKQIAWFGVSNVNGQEVTTTPSNPFGSGQYGNLGPEQVYTY